MATRNGSWLFQERLTKTIRRVFFSCPEDKLGDKRKRTRIKTIETCLGKLSWLMRCWPLLSRSGGWVQDGNSLSRLLQIRIPQCFSVLPVETAKTHKAYQFDSESSISAAALAARHRVAGVLRVGEGARRASGSGRHCALLPESLCPRPAHHG